MLLGEDDLKYVLHNIYDSTAASSVLLIPIMCESVENKQFGRFLNFSFIRHLLISLRNFFFISSRNLIVKISYSSVESLTLPYEVI